MGLIAWRGDRLRSPGSIDSPVSREGAFLANNVLFAGFAFVVLLGTVFPLLVEAINGDQISVGRPYFDRMTIPLGLSLLTLMAIAPVLPWRKASGELLRHRLLWPAWFGVATATLAVVLGSAGWAATIAFFLGGFAGGSALRQVALATRRQGWRGLVGRANGGMIVHLGVVVIAVALAASGSFSTAGEFQLAVGETARISGHTVTFRGFEDVVDAQKSERKARLELDGGQEYAPALQTFPNGTTAIGVPSVRTGLVHDVYMTLLPSPNAPEGTARVRVMIMPMAVWLWIGGAIMAVGTILAAFPGRRRRPDRPVVRAGAVPLRRPRGAGRADRAGRRAMTAGAPPDEVVSDPDGAAPGAARARAPPGRAAAGWPLAGRPGGRRARPAGARPVHLGTGRRPPGQQPAPGQARARAHVRGPPGRPVLDLGDLRGRWVLVNYFAPWCVPCRQEHPELVSFSQRHDIAGDAEVVSVVFDDSRAPATSSPKEGGRLDRGDRPRPAPSRSTGRVAKVPESFLVDPDGFVVPRLNGASPPMGSTAAGARRAGPVRRGGGVGVGVVSTRRAALRSWLPWLLLAVALVVVLGVGGSRDGGPATNAERVEHLATRIAAPPVAASRWTSPTSTASQAMRTEIARRVQAGETDGEILSYVVSKYGDDIAPAAAVGRGEQPGVVPARGGAGAGRRRAGAGLPALEGHGPGGTAGRRRPRAGRRRAGGRARRRRGGGVGPVTDVRRRAPAGASDLDALAELEDERAFLLRSLTTSTASTPPATSTRSTTPPCATATRRGPRRCCTPSTRAAPRLPSPATGGGAAGARRAGGGRDPGPGRGGRRCSSAGSSGHRGRRARPSPGASRSSTSQLLSEARLAQRDDMLTAIKLYDEVLKTDPDNAEALTYRGWLLLQTGDSELMSKGEASLDQAIGTNPDYPDARAFKGIVLLRLHDDPVGASEQFRIFLASDPPPEVQALVAGVITEAAEAAKAAGEGTPTTVAPT